MWNFQGLIKNKVEFPRVANKNNVEFPGVLVFGIGISSGSKTILWNIQGGTLFCLEFPDVKYSNEKFQGGFQKSMSSTPLFGFFLEQPIYILHICDKLSNQ